MINSALEVKLHIQQMRMDSAEMRQKSHELAITAESISEQADALEKLFSYELSKLDESQYTYSSKQKTRCSGCGNVKHTPLRVDYMGGYVCLTCIDEELHKSNEMVFTDIKPILSPRVKAL